jgi:hypothetical protein
MPGASQLLTEGHDRDANEANPARSTRSERVALPPAACAQLCARTLRCHPVPRVPDADPTWLTTLKDLGVPGLIGAVVGAFIGHFTAKARGREENERTRQRMLLQDERRAALDMLAALREMRSRLQGDFDAWGVFLNEYQDRVVAPARLVRSAELDRRVTAGASALFYAMLAHGAYMNYAAGRACGDAEDWIEAWLRDESPPDAVLPTSEEMNEIIVKDGTLDVQRLVTWLQKRL